MKIVTIYGMLIVLAVVLFAHANAQGADTPKDWINVNVRGSNEWHNLQALLKISNEYIRAKNPKFSPRKYQITAAIITQDSKELLTFQLLSRVWPHGYSDKT